MFRVKESVFWGSSIPVGATRSKHNYLYSVCAICDREWNSTQSTGRAASSVDKHVPYAHLKLRISSALPRLHWLKLFSVIQCTELFSYWVSIYWSLHWEGRNLIYIFFNPCHIIPHLWLASSVNNDGGKKLSVIFKSNWINQGKWSSRTKIWRKQLSLVFVCCNKKTDSVKNGIMKYLRTETLWPAVCFTKFLEFWSFLNVLLCLIGCLWICLKTL